jgi:hypothetical protein
LPRKLPLKYNKKESLERKERKTKWGFVVEID